MPPNTAGHLTVSLKSQSENGCSLPVANNGSVFPDAFDPDACKGLGMKVIRSYVKRIGGELQYGPGDRNQGARFTVLFESYRLGFLVGVSSHF